jgi:hypothetical protein
MRVRITFYGMVLIELSKKDRVARVLAINATTINRPYHHPILCANRGTLAIDPPLPAIPSLDGLLDRTSTELRSNAEGWHLSGTIMAAGRGRLPKHRRGFSSKEPRHPKSVDGPWDSLKWIPDLSAIQPGARLRDDYRKISRSVLAIIELRGGALTAQKPTTTQDAGVLWWFSPTCQQAATDLFVWEGDIGDGITITDQSGVTRAARPRRTKDVTELFVSHEAPRFEKELQLERITRERGEQELAAHPFLDHFPMFYAALERCPYAVESPRGVWRFDERAETAYQSTISCIPSMI